MNFLKRSWLSVWNRKGRTILLWITLFVICNFVLAGLIIQTASSNAAEYARKQLGGSVSLSINQQEMEQNAMSGKTTADLPKLTTADANLLTKLPHVANYNYFQNAFANADKFKYVKGQSLPSGGHVMMNVGGQTASSANLPDLQVEGDLSTRYSQDFVNHNAHLVSGRFITPQDAGKHQALVSQTVAKLNGWKIGDKFTVDSINSSDTEKFTIVGIFTASTSATGGMPNLSMSNPQNKIYTDYKDIAPFVSGSTKDAISGATYYMDDPANINTFEQAAKSTSINWKSFALDANNAEYQQMTGPINNVASFAQKMVIVVAIAGAVILGLIVMLSMRERNFEVGILLSLGERRWKVMSQFLIEMVLIGAVAFGVSIFTGNLLSQRMANTLLKSEVTMAQQNESNQQSGVRQFSSTNGVRQGGTTNVQPISHLDTSLSANSLEKSGLFGFIILVLATLLPSFAVMRLKPREILSRRE